MNACKTFTVQYLKLEAFLYEITNFALNHYYTVSQFYGFRAEFNFFESIKPGIQFSNFLSVLGAKSFGR